MSLWREFTDSAQIPIEEGRRTLPAGIEVTIVGGDLHVGEKGVVVRASYSLATVRGADGRERFFYTGQLAPSENPDRDSFACAECGLVVSPKYACPTCPAPAPVPLYRRAFPEFEMDVEIPEGFEDISYQHDEAPSFLHSGRQVRLWIHDRADARAQGFGRFVVEPVAVYEDGEIETLPDAEVYLTDSWDDALAWISGHPVVAPTPRVVRVTEKHAQLGGTIVTEKRTSDWIAFVVGEPGEWESGRSEAEAVGKLVISRGTRLARLMVVGE